jgi:hypothetical protein
MIYANNVTELRGLPGDSNAERLAILAGYTTPGDGGGGVFYWESGNAVDDGGTILNQNAGAAGVAQSGWRRVYSGPLNIRWFGAASDSNDDQGPIIQRVLNIAVDKPYYPAVYIPAGQYNVQTAVLIPRRGYRGLTISGDGRDASILSGASLDEATPVVGFGFDVKPDPEKSVNLKIEDLSFQRDNPGAVFVYLSFSGKLRLQSSVFRNIVFNVPYSGKGNYTQQSPLYIEGARYCHFENLTCTGGESSFVLKDSSYCTVQDFTTNGDHHQHGGIRVIGGAHHVFRNIHIDACGMDTSYGVGFSLEKGSTGAHPTAIVIDTISCEGGKSTSPQINIESGKGITIINPAIGGGGSNNNQVGLRIGDDASGVRIIGGWMQAMNNPPTNQGSNHTLTISAMANGVFIDGTVLEGSNNLEADISIDSAARNVRAEFMVKPNANAACYQYARKAGT